MNRTAIGLLAILCVGCRSPATFSHQPEYRSKPVFAVAPAVTAFWVEFPKDKQMEFFRVRARTINDVSDWATVGPGPDHAPAPGNVSVNWYHKTDELAWLTGFEVWSCTDLNSWGLRTNLPAHE